MIYACAVGDWYVCMASVCVYVCKVWVCVCVCDVYRICVYLGCVCVVCIYWVWYIVYVGALCEICVWCLHECVGLFLWYVHM